MKRLFKALIALAAIIVVVVGVTGYYLLSGKPEGGSKPIRIGVPLPMTGTLSYGGVEAWKSITMAQEEINDAGGINGRPIELVLRDIKDFDPTLVQRDITYLITQEKVDAVITWAVSFTSFEVTLFRDYGIPYLYSSTPHSFEPYLQDEGIETYWMVFNPQPHIKNSISPLFNYVEGLDAYNYSLPNKKLALIYSTDAFSVRFANYSRAEAQKRGWELVLDEQVTFGEISEWGTVLSKIRSSNPSFIIDADFVPGNQASFLLQFEQNPTNSIIYMQYGASLPEFVAAVGTKGDGIMWSTTYATLPTSQGQAWVQNYKDRWGEDPSSTAPNSYIMLYVYAEAARKVLAEGKDVTDYRDICTKIAETNLTTAMGQLAFEPDTHWGKSGAEWFPCPLMQMQEGKYYWIDPTSQKQRGFLLPPWISG